MQVVGVYHQPRRALDHVEHDRVLVLLTVPGDRLAAGGVVELQRKLVRPTLEGLRKVTTAKGVFDRAPYRPRLAVMADGLVDPLFRGGAASARAKCRCAQRDDEHEPLRAVDHGRHRTWPSANHAESRS